MLSLNVKQVENVSILYTKKGNTHLQKNKCNTLSIPEVFYQCKRQKHCSANNLWKRDRGSLYSEKQHKYLFWNLRSKSLQNTCEGVYF